MYKSLQGSRAIAAMLVVLFHLGGAIADEKYFGVSSFSIPFSFGGSAGVDFFFVLSGFIILTAHRRDVFQPKQITSYLIKRLSRIYPAYWMVFLSVFFLAIASSALRNTVPHELFIILKSLLLIPQDNNLVGGTGAPVLCVAWTLQYEMFFYLAFTCLILNRWLSVIVGFALLYCYVNYHGAPSLPLFLSFLSKDYILLFGIGMGISLACNSLEMTKNKSILFVFVGVAMFLALIWGDITGSELCTERLTLLYGLASSLIIFGFVQAEKRGKIILGYNWLQVLGDSSYALYLIHYPLISILCKLSLALQLNKLGIIGAMISYLVIFGVSLISSVIFHIWIEKPFAIYLKNRSTNRQLWMKQIKGSDSEVSTPVF